MKKVDDYLALRRAAGYALEVPEHRWRVTTEHKLLFISVRGRRLAASAQANMGVGRAFMIYATVGWVFRRLLVGVAWRYQ